MPRNTGAVVSTVQLNTCAGSTLPASSNACTNSTCGPSDRLNKSTDSTEEASTVHENVITFELAVPDNNTARADSECAPALKGPMRKEDQHGANTVPSTAHSNSAGTAVEASLKEPNDDVDTASGVNTNCAEPGLAAGANHVVTVVGA